MSKYFIHKFTQYNLKKTKGGQNIQVRKYSSVTRGQILICERYKLEYLAVYLFSVKIVLISSNLFSVYTFQ